MSEPIIKVTGLGKQYIISHEAKKSYTALRDVISGKVKNLGKKAPKRTKEEFWALRDISFDISRGDTVGIIGRNGAGKSTLLKVLSRITEPTNGRLEINGRIASLLEVGTGFHPELTGRENIFLNGAILGMSRFEIRRKFDEIVGFSEVGKFLDTPVKRYSSGMYVRLAFSVAAHLEPDILVVDEVLAVGDAEFQKKCLGKMDDVSKRDGATILFVSHNMPAVQQFCRRGIVLDNGQVKMDSTIENAVALYLHSNDAHLNRWEARSSKDSEVYISSISTELLGQQPDHTLRITTRLKVNEVYTKSCLAYYIGSTDSTPLMESIPQYNFIDCSVPGSEIEVTVDIYLPPMIPGTYTLGVWLGVGHTHTLDWQKEALKFIITSNPMENRTVEYPRHAGFVVPKSRIVKNERL
jgi:lipopolysaccharide transport system ATP-binding protein